MAEASESSPLSLKAVMAARRQSVVIAGRRRLFWREMATSLWAPISLLGLVFIPYVVLIEFFPSTASWAQKGMQGFAFVMLVAFLGLLSWRITSPKERVLRRLRREGRELEAELEGLLKRAGSKVSPAVRERLAEQALRTEEASLAQDVDALERELKALQELSTQHLQAFRQGSAFDFASGFVKALAVALLIRTIVVEPFKIPSGSMLPTLEIGDQVFVNKFIYGVRLPFVNRVPFVIVRAPERGDVIVFNNPVDESKDFIKRVVGIAGDTVELRDEVVFINGMEQPRKLISDNFTVYNRDERDWFSEKAALYVELLADRQHPVLQMPYHPKGQVTEGPFVVPEGHVFVLGDNRDNSSDSRYGLGVTHQVEFVPVGNIKGKAMVIWLALGHGGAFHQLTGGTGLRTDRLFLPVR